MKATVRVRRGIAVLVAVSLLLSGATAATAADDWIMAGHDAQASNYNPGEHVISTAGVPSLHHAWRLPGVTLAAATAKRLYAALSGPTESVIVAIDARSGKTLRTFPATRAGQTPSSLVYARGRIVASGPGVTIGVRASGAGGVWKAGGSDHLAVEEGRVFASPPCASGDVSCSSMGLRAMNLSNGRVFWRQRTVLGGPPVLVNGRLYAAIAGNAPRTRVFDPRSGSALATLNEGGEWFGDTNGLFLVSRLGQHRSLARIGPTGKPMWREDLGKVVTGAPALAYGTVFATSNRFHAGIVAVNAKNGRLRWAADLGANLTLAVANHLLFALHADTGALDVLDAGTGKVLRTLPVFGFAASRTQPSMLVAGGTIYVLDGRGMTAIRP